MEDLRESITKFMKSADALKAARRTAIAISAITAAKLEKRNKIDPSSQKTKTTPVESSRGGRVIMQRIEINDEIHERKVFVAKPLSLIAKITKKTAASVKARPSFVIGK